jgi:D-beta-D-heptose 7-phosphate kinase/D-beta-D-heptose 1-phosphate adenosyltransferase
MLDRYFWGNVQRISPEAPVPVFQVNKRSEVAGGDGNVVSNLSDIACSVAVVGICGEDAGGERLKGILGADCVTVKMIPQTLNIC